MLDKRTNDGHDQPWLPPSARRPYEHEESQEPDIFRRWNMNRRKHFFAIGMTVLMLGFIGIASVNAAEPKSTQANWESLKQLATGQEVRVVLNDAKSYSGQFQSVSDEGFVVRLGKDTRRSSGKISPGLHARQEPSRPERADRPRCRRRCRGRCRCCFP